MKQESLNESKLQDCTGELFGEVPYFIGDGSLSIACEVEACLYIDNQDGKSEPLVMKQEHREWTPVWTRKL